MVRDKEDEFKDIQEVATISNINKLEPGSSRYAVEDTPGKICKTLCLNTLLPGPIAAGGAGQGHGGGQGGGQGEAAPSQEVQDKDVVHTHAQPDDNLQEVHEWHSAGGGQAGHQVGGQEQGEQGDCDDVQHLGVGGGVAGPNRKLC